MRRVGWVAVASAFVAVACTKVESSSIKTAGMSAHINVTADGSGKATASATLNVDGNVTDYVDLSAGDAFSATAGGKTQSMDRNNVLNVISYTTDFTGGLDAENTAYTIAFTRASDTSAPSSTCAMPKPYAIKTPASGATLSRTKDDLVVTWDVVGSDPMTYDVSGPCIQGIVQQSIASDTGTLTIAKGTLVPSDPSHANDTCQATIALRRTRNGTLDPAYGHGGAIFAQQTRSLTISSTP